MPDLLLELFSEEIPARMQERAAADLKSLVEAKLAALQLSGTSARTYVTPRRLALVVEGLPERQPDREVEVKGPRVGAPEQAIAGFLRSAGLASIDQTEIRDTGKGSFHFAVNRIAGQSIEAALAQILAEVLDAFPWPKSMRWAGHTVRWVRPLHNILAILTREGGERSIVPLRWSLDRGSATPTVLEANDHTYGHRFMAPGRVEIEDFAEYPATLRDAKVVVDPAERKRMILAEGARLAAAEGLRVKEDLGLLDEVAGLVEWPVVRMGRIEPRFMALPGEVLTTSMRTHQKYFACETSDGKVAPFFIVVGNNETRDGGAQMVAGNERVLRARLSDAQFFWDLDREARLESRVPKLKERVFHAKLGSVHDKVERMVTLASVLVAFVPGAEIVAAQRAAYLAKADLSSTLVGEFPELQGIMGRYLALHDGERPEVAQAIARHYAPAGLDDPTPFAPLDIVVALADKLDTLVGFFAIDEKPTGSKDPFALRRAALGVIRIILDNALRLPLLSIIQAAWANFFAASIIEVLQLPDSTLPDSAVRETALLDFFADRLKVVLRERGVRHDLIAAVFALGDEDDLVRLLARVSALQEVLGTEDGTNLLTAYRRASKIVAIEEKKDKVNYRSAVDRGLLREPEEIDLEGALRAFERDLETLLKQEKFEAAMQALALLRRPVDEFFERVTVNTEDAALRANRLCLLAQIWATLNRVADFSRIEG